MNTTETTTAVTPTRSDALALLTVSDVSAATGYTEAAIRHLIARGRIPVVRIGRSVRVRVSDLHAWIDGHTQPAESDR